MRLRDVYDDKQHGARHKERGLLEGKPNHGIIPDIQASCCGRWLHLWFTPDQRGPTDRCLIKRCSKN